MSDDFDVQVQAQSNKITSEEFDTIWSEFLEMMTYAND